MWGPFKRWASFAWVFLVRLRVFRLIHYKDFSTSYSHLVGAPRALAPPQTLTIYVDGRQIMVVALDSQGMFFEQFSDIPESPGPVSRRHTVQPGLNIELRQRRKDCRVKHEQPVLLLKVVASSVA